MKPPGQTYEIRFSTTVIHGSLSLTRTGKRCGDSAGHPSIISIQPVARCERPCFGLSLADRRPQDCVVSTRSARLTVTVEFHSQTAFVVSKSWFASAYGNASAMPSKEPVLFTS